MYLFNMYVCMYVLLYVCIHIRGGELTRFIYVEYTGERVCIYTYIYVCIYFCMCIHLCVYLGGLRFRSGGPGRPHSRLSDCVRTLGVNGSGVFCSICALKERERIHPRRDSDLQDLFEGS